MNQFPVVAADRTNREDLQLRHSAVAEVKWRAGVTQSALPPSLSTPSSCYFH